LGPLILAAIAVVPARLARSGAQTPPTIALLDSADVLGLDAWTVPDTGLARGVRLSQAPLHLDKSVLIGLVEDHAIDGLLAISPDGSRAELVTGSRIDASEGARLYSDLGALLYDAVVRRRGTSLGLDDRSVADLTAPPAWTRITVGSSDPMRAAGLALFMSTMLYLTLLTYGLATMRSVVEEKTSRVIELLLTSARPTGLLVGKTCGIAVAGITQYAVWFLLGLGLTRVGGATHSMFTWLPQFTVGPGLAVACVAYFLLGYALFAACYVMVGGMVSSTADAHHAHVPVTALMVAPMVLVWLVVAAPESVPARALSLVPFFSPVLMIPRIAMGAAPLGDVAASVILLVVASVALFRMAARVYRAGLLLRGKPATLREVVRWIREP
jgi:ABC-2 type transport system permease protein